MHQDLTLSLILSACRDLSTQGRWLQITVHSKGSSTSYTLPNHMLN